MVNFIDYSISYKTMFEQSALSLLAWRALLKKLEHSTLVLKGIYQNQLISWPMVKVPILLQRHMCFNFSSLSFSPSYNKPIFLPLQAMQLQSPRLLMSGALLSLRGHRCFHSSQAFMDQHLCRILLLWSWVDYWPDQDFHGCRFERILLWREILVRCL